MLVTKQPRTRVEITSLSFGTAREIGGNDAIFGLENSLDNVIWQLQDSSSDILLRLW